MQWRGDQTSFSYASVSLMWQSNVDCTLAVVDHSQVSLSFNKPAELFLKNVYQPCARTCVERGAGHKHVHGKDVVCYSTWLSTVCPRLSTVCPDAMDRCYCSASLSSSPISR